MSPTHSGITVKIAKTDNDTPEIFEISENHTLQLEAVQKIWKKAVGICYKNEGGECVNVYNENGILHVVPDTTYSCRISNETEFENGEREKGVTELLGNSKPETRKDNSLPPSSSKKKVFQISCISSVDDAGERKKEVQIHFLKNFKPAATRKNNLLALPSSTKKNKYFRIPHVPSVDKEEREVVRYFRNLKPPRIKDSLPSFHHLREWYRRYLDDIIACGICLSIVLIFVIFIYVCYTEGHVKAIALLLATEKRNNISAIKRLNFTG